MASPSARYDNARAHARNNLRTIWETGVASRHGHIALVAAGVVHQQQQAVVIRNLRVNERLLFGTFSNVPTYEGLLFRTELV